MSKTIRHRKDDSTWNHRTPFYGDFRPGAFNGPSQMRRLFNRLERAKFDRELYQLLLNEEANGISPHKNSLNYIWF